MRSVLVKVGVVALVQLALVGVAVAPGCRLGSPAMSTASVSPRRPHRPVPGRVRRPRLSGPRRQADVAQPRGRRRRLHHAGP